MDSICCLYELRVRLVNISYCTVTFKLISHIYLLRSVYLYTPLNSLRRLYEARVKPDNIKYILPSVNPHSTSHRHLQDPRFKFSMFPAPPNRERTAQLPRFWFSHCRHLRVDSLIVCTGNWSHLLISTVAYYGQSRNSMLSARTFGYGWDPFPTFVFIQI